VSHSGSGGDTVAKGGGNWQIGLGADVAWITNSTEAGLSITSAIPPIFDAYATIVMPEPGVPSLVADHELRVLRLLMAETADQDWWLGYLDTGTDDVVFPDAPRVLLYANWGYVVVKAGPAQSQLWRTVGSTPRHPRLPDLMFPEDRTWLLSTLWDDDWWCLGGSTGLVDAFVADPGLSGHLVGTDDDATPPRHVA
jgi:hypothetical protein